MQPISTFSPADMCDPGSAPGRVILTTSLMSDQAVPLLDALRAADGAIVHLDAQAVERIGGLCLQVLISARRSFCAVGRDLVFDHPSEAFVDALGLLGARELLMAGSVS